MHLTNQWLEEGSGLTVFVEMLPVAPHSLKKFNNEYQPTIKYYETIMYCTADSTTNGNSTKF